MKRKLTDKQFTNAYRSAGLWFVALYMEAFILRLDELHDRDSKYALVREIYNGGENADDYIGGTRTRVNSLQRIIDGGRVIEVLTIAAKSTRLRGDFPAAVTTAKELLDRIEKDEISLPE